MTRMAHVHAPRLRLGGFGTVGADLSTRQNRAISSINRMKRAQTNG
jgi:hypothetical protein